MNQKRRGEQHEKWAAISLGATALVAALLLLLASPAKADDRVPAGSRPATAADLVGNWQVVQWSTMVEASQLGSYAAPYQWYGFDSDGALRSMTSNQLNANARQIRKTLENMPVGMRYAVPSAGKVETMQVDAPNARESWRALMVTRSARDAAAGIDLQQGDVVMTLLGADEQPLYTRQMRRLEAAAPPVLFPR
ncbi:MAG: hypothetical protein AB7O59_04445 [Pirellulales bacterium]